MNNKWQSSGNNFRAAAPTPPLDRLPGGIYEYVMTMEGWHLNRRQTEFEFPHKIYGLHDPIIKRVKKAWDALQGNLGVNFNGLKGTGKTICAQVLVNWFVNHVQVPVLVIPGALPLDTILNNIQQDLILVFDEFEKTHNQEQQEKLLSTLDGMSRSRHKRLFLFTTNEPKLHDKLLDRPGRIRYTWSFDRLEEEVIREVIDDLLHENKKHFAGDIVDFIRTRKVASIDVARTVINEVNIFNESPFEFKDIINLSEREPAALRVIAVDEKLNEIAVLDDYFRPKYVYDMTYAFTATAAADFALGNFSPSRQWNKDDTKIHLIKPFSEDGKVWVAKIEVKLSKVWNLWHVCPEAAKNLEYDFFQICEKPENWQLPDFVHDLNAEHLTDEAFQEAHDKLREWEKQRTIYGLPAHQFLIKVEPVFEYNWDRAISNSSSSEPPAILKPAEAVAKRTKSFDTEQPSERVKQSN